MAFEGRSRAARLEHRWHSHAIPKITPKLGIGRAGVASVGVLDPRSWHDDFAFNIQRARYHVINRGNLQHDVFLTCGSKNAFLIALDEAAAQFGWQVHAFVVMRSTIW